MVHFQIIFFINIPKNLSLPRIPAWLDKSLTFSPSKKLLPNNLMISGGNLFIHPRISFSLTARIRPGQILPPLDQKPRHFRFMVMNFFAGIQMQLLFRTGQSHIKHSPLFFHIRRKNRFFVGRDAFIDVNDMHSIKLANVTASSRFPSRL